MSNATLQTSAGPVTVELHDEAAPKTVANFRKLASDGFYDGLTFHRVIPDFMIQGGCPEGTGTGGPGYTFEDEINDNKVVRGALAMANAGPDTNGSQFFIVTTEAAPWLDDKHTVFGRVTEGMDAVDAIEAAPTGAGDRPLEPQVIERIELAGASRRARRWLADRGWPGSGACSAASRTPTARRSSTSATPASTTGRSSATSASWRRPGPGASTSASAGSIRC